MPNSGGLTAVYQAYRSMLSRAITSTLTAVEASPRRLSVSALSNDTYNLLWNRLPVWRSYMRFYDRVTKELGGRINESVVVLARVFTRQCSAIAAQRCRRSAQIVVLYNNLGYDRKLIKTVVERLSRNFGTKLSDRPLYLLFGAVIFAWDKNRISDDELTGVAEEINHIRRDDHGLSITDQRYDRWEKVIDRAHLTAWRKPVADSHLYEYKVYGTYDDLSARSFYNAQVDLEFRKQWDKLVVSLDVVDREEESDSEVVKWVTHFPYPMYSREYLYVRRCKIDNQKNLMFLINRSINHPMYPVTGKYVRVDNYVSKMVIKPHTSFDENGFDYVLTYFDDPKSAFPSVAYNWMANTGVPDFVDKVHTAALMLHERRRKYKKDEVRGDGHVIPM